MGAWYLTQKGYFAPFSVVSGAKILQDHSFPISHSSAKFHTNPSSLRGDIYENVFQTHYNIGVKPVGFSPTITRLNLARKLCREWSSTRMYGCQAYSGTSLMARSTM